MESVVASAILYAVACWGSRLRVADANRLNKLIRKASDVVGVELDSLMAVSERRTLSKLQTIMDNGSHPLYHTVMSHRSTFSARLIQPKCTTERHRRSYVQESQDLQEPLVPAVFGERRCHVFPEDQESGGSLDYRFWGVTYTRDGVCALKGSSVDLSCSYKHPEGLRVTRSFWFTEGLSQDGEPQDVRESDQYRGRVRYSRTPNPGTMTITGLRETDTQTYRFRFYTDDPDGRYTGEPGVSLSVTDLKITVSHTGGGGRWLTCSSTCTPSNPTFIWYRNGQPVLHQNRHELYLNSRTVDAGSYSCAVKGYENLCSPAVCKTSL
ncbi:hypothetical protein NFI96_026874 [Prochilodus magdalenae]|nr:hypothetical protein NFI96_026874 [Prochilodus magdalenae]